MFSSLNLRSNFRLNLRTVAHSASFLAGIAVCALTASAPAIAQFKSGTDYNIINPPQSVPDDSKIEVLEFFAYGCGACAALEPKLEQWAKRQPADVAFRRVPAATTTFKLRGIDNAPLYYTLELMGLAPKLHEKVFQAANFDGVLLGNASDQNKWLAKQGVDVALFESTKKSFSVDAKSKAALKLAEQYKISSTPTMVVGGKFILSQTQGADHFLAVIDSLIVQARASMKKPAASAVSAAPAAATAVAAATPAASKTVAKPKVATTKAPAAPAVAPAVQ